MEEIGFVTLTPGLNTSSMIISFALNSRVFFMTHNALRHEGEETGKYIDIYIYLVIEITR